jgi:hypothetical protein
LVAVVIFHIGGTVAHLVGQFAPLCGAFIGAALTLFCVALPHMRGEKTERWLKGEQLSWLLIGCGMLAWGIGESFWRYYVSMGDTPFPSLADAGYSLFPLFVFAGLLLQPAPVQRSRRHVLLLDSLISMGSIFAIAWYLLLGSLAQAQGEASLAKFLGIYYPIADTALLSCILFLLLRGQGRAYHVAARRMGLLIAGVGILFFVSSDFLFNIQQNAGTYVEATWVDLGWPLGMITLGIAAYMRRYLPATPETELEYAEQRSERQVLHLQQLVPYGLLVLLFLALTYNVLSNDAGQRAIRPVLLISTLLVVLLVIVRQLLTLWENIQLTQQQAESLRNLEQANKRIEEQSKQIADHNMELEQGIEHLKSVQASLANGNMGARARLTSGALMPLGRSLNLMAERLLRLGQSAAYSKRLSHALADLGTALERTALGHPLNIPESCGELPEMQRLLVAMRVRRVPAPASSSLLSTIQQVGSQPHAHANAQPAVQASWQGNGRISDQQRENGYEGRLRPASQAVGSSSPFPVLPATPPAAQPVTQAMTLPKHESGEPRTEHPTVQSLRSASTQHNTGDLMQGERDIQAFSGREGTVKAHKFGLRPSPLWDGTEKQG